MKQDIKQHVNAYSHYQQFKMSSLVPAGLLQPLPIPIILLVDTRSMNGVQSVPP